MRELERDLPHTGPRETGGEALPSRADRARIAGGRAGAGMSVMRTASALRQALASARREGLRIALVPTMGSLHEGHLSLLRAAREDCDLVVMSLFVNPAQFGSEEDLDTYPSDLDRDATLAADAGVDLLYAPAVDEVYPAGFATAVEVGGELTGVLCGDPDRRGPEHFRGVTTIVAKLLNTIQPDVAFFGQKDAQQAVVIRRMVRDLDYPTEIEVLPTVREADGLALSSRNLRLDAEERRRAGALIRALGAAKAVADAGEARTDVALRAAREELERAGIDPEYLEARDAEDLTPAESFNGRPVLVAVAARVGTARLIDNLVIGG